MITASAVDRVLACPASAVLPQVAETSAAAERGTAVHAYVASRAALDRDAALARVPEPWRATCEAIDTGDILSAGRWSHEVAFAYDVDTGQARVLGIDSKRDYRSVAPSEIAGTADLLGLTEDRVVVLDWKTGGDMGPPALSGQLRTLALMACRVPDYARSAATVGYAYLREDEEPRLVVAELDAFDMDMHAATLRDLVDRVDRDRIVVEAGRVPPMSLGEHCQYCPARRVCPAQMAMVRTMADGSEPASLVQMIPMTPAVAATAYQRLQQARMALAIIDGAVRAAALEHGGLDLGDGRVWGPCETTRETIDGDAAYAVLRRIHGQDVADAAVSREATKRGIRAALQPLAKGSGVPLAKMEREVLDELREAGCVEARTTTTFREHGGTK